jgi:hypothetical protein
MGAFITFDRFNKRHHLVLFAGIASEGVGVARTDHEACLSV